jgi:type I restriction enzyme S subunit
VPGQDVDSAFLYYALMRAVPDLQELGSGATFTEISKTQLEGFQIPHPALGEQKRMAAILKEQMATVERARVAAEAQLEAANALSATAPSSVAAART